jgi:beta-glucosidase
VCQACFMLLMSFNMSRTETKAIFESLLSQLTLEEKVSLLSGHQFNATPGVPRLGIPPIKV